MMKKVMLGSLLLSSLLMAEESISKEELEKLKAEIAKVKDEKSALDKKLKALEAKLPQDTSLKTHTELGYIATHGNTKTETFLFDTKWKKEWDKNVVTWTFDAQYATNDNEEIKNKYMTELDYGYKFTKRFSLNYLIGYKDDKFSAYDYQFYTGPGAKYKVVKTKAHDLSLEGNILYSLDQPYGDVPSNEYASFQAKGVYSWQITKTLKFEEEASYRVDLGYGQNYFVYSATKISSKFSDIFSGGLGYKVDYVNQPGDKKRTDTTLTANLIMDY